MEEVADVRIPVRYADGHVGLARVRCLEPTGAGLSELELHLFLEGEDTQVFKSGQLGSDSNFAHHRNAQLHRELQLERLRDRPGRSTR